MAPTRDGRARNAENAGDQVGYEGLERRLERSHHGYPTCDFQAHSKLSWSRQHMLLNLGERMMRCTEWISKT